MLPWQSELLPQRSILPTLGKGEGKKAAIGSGCQAVGPNDPRLSGFQKSIVSWDMGGDAPRHWWTALLLAFYAVLKPIVKLVLLNMHGIGLPV